MLCYLCQSPLNKKAGKVMGRMTAIDLQEQGLSLEDQIAIHFSSNCYPPIPKVMIPVAIEAIDAYHNEEFAKVIQLPEGVEFRNGENWVFASQAIESLRLDAWLPEIFWTEEDEEE
jgi:hypothetical protein